MTVLGCAAAVGRGGRRLVGPFCSQSRGDGALVDCPVFLVLHVSCVGRGLGLGYYIKASRKADPFVFLSLPQEGHRDDPTIVLVVVWLRGKPVLSWGASEGAHVGYCCSWTYL